MGKINGGRYHFCWIFCWGLFRALALWLFCVFIGVLRLLWVLLGKLGGNGYALSVGFLFLFGVLRGARGGGRDGVLVSVSFLWLEGCLRGEVAWRWLWKRCSRWSSG